MYKRVVTIREITRMRNMLLRLKRYSAAEWETLSNPIKAQGEMNAICTTCLNAFPSGRKAGSMDTPAAGRPIMAAAKQTVIPAVKTSARISMQRAVAFLLLAHSSPTSPITASVTSTSPRYTSYPKAV